MISAVMALDAALASVRGAGAGTCAAPCGGRLAAATAFPPTSANDPRSGRGGPCCQIPGTPKAGDDRTRRAHTCRCGCHEAAREVLSGLGR
jgi:hypothetical protein